MTTWRPVAHVDDLSPGDVRRIDAAVAGTTGDVALVRDEHGTFHAVDDTCTHFIASLSRGRLDGGCLVCPAHGARYLVTSGAEVSGRGHAPLLVHRVRVCGDQVQLLPTRRER